jgi:hypothetical protein
MKAVGIALGDCDLNLSKQYNPSWAAADDCAFTAERRPLTATASSFVPSAAAVRLVSGTARKAVVKAKKAIHAGMPSGCGQHLRRDPLIIKAPLFVYRRLRAGRGHSHVGKP